jgi:hypothetical protein
VTCVTFCSALRLLYCGGGKSESGSDNGGNGVTISLDGTLTVDEFKSLAFPVTSAVDENDLQLCGIRMMKLVEINIEKIKK